MTNLFTLEALNEAHQVAIRIDEDADTRAWIKADNRLLDACIDAGMDREHVDHRGWAAIRITRWLEAA